MPDDRPDADLLAAARAGDDCAFEALYRRHRDFVLRVAARYAGDEALALDAAQETFVYLLKKLPTLTLSGRLSTYLYPIARSTAVTLRRRRGHLRFTTDPAPATPAPLAPTPDLDATLRAAVEGLPEDQREVLLLRVLEGLSVEETAAAVGVPPGTVKSRLYHALAKLRERPDLRALLEDP